YLNNFIDNAYNVYSSDSSNIWNSTSLITYTYNGNTYTNYLGNYWSDYTGSDTDGDGIGDTPYIIPNDNNDSYPLMESFENYEISTGEIIRGVDAGITAGSDVNWNQVYDAGYRFVFLKATEGVNWPSPINNPDIYNTVRENVREARDAGLIVGVYHFARPIDKDGNPQNDPVEEAESFVNLAGDFLKTGYLRPALDLEDNDYGEHPELLGKENLAQWIKTWMDTVKAETGVEPILYMNPYLFKFLNDSSIVDQYDIWVYDAYHNPDNEEPNLNGWSTWSSWQYEWGVDTYGGQLDLDVFNGDMSGLLDLVIGGGYQPPNVVYVDDDYNPSTPGWGYDHFDKIQDAIDAVAEGGFVYVYNGTYYENIIIDKSINLIGENRNTTIIDGNYIGDVINIVTNWVNISDFKVQNSGSYSPSAAGIKLSDVQDCHIENTIITNNKYGIYISSSCCAVFDDIVSNNHFGITLIFSDSCTISDTTISNNFWYGIELSSSSICTITNNEMIENSIFISGDMLSHWNTHTIDTSNTVNGRPVYYWKNRVGGTIPYGAGEVILANCSGVRVDRQDISNGTVGIEVGFSSGCSISNNT
ncbi:MAG TPA: hypothetical protein ENI44_01640, partial [Thermoplasmatales archaeon]|nr:hypothetical protein [Thermoplasmatales archaeon]